MLLKVENTSTMPNATTTSRTLDFGIDKKKLNVTNFKKRWRPHYNEVRRIIIEKSIDSGVAALPKAQCIA
jgi:hypothetical protein